MGEKDGRASEIIRDIRRIFHAEGLFQTFFLAQKPVQ